ncbi:cob(I)yrinic acid a,c-diamide adenosyltransferase [Candidatus Peregrinibacteria bacterium]|nr:cob(I)yrinic acid a,c-diamide adenosyltransferase [Candidatus Peregrinibacteria bacterium]
MKIYTKTGDKGQTGLYGGERVGKDSPRMESIGTVDELNAMIGVCRSYSLPPEAAEVLHSVQQQLFVLGSDLATPVNAQKDAPRISAEDVGSLEENIDALQADLPELKQFILPGGTLAGAQLHAARAVCRRAERAIVAFVGEEEWGELCLQYVNRLSDFLFVLARWVNQEEGGLEEEWKGLV